MTPMEKLKPQFDDLKILLGQSFKEINLNKSSYKEEYVGFCGEKTQHINKGVKSDFIRLFRLEENKENTFTLAFSFDYLDLSEENYKIVFSTSVGKEEKKFSEKLELNVEETREKLNTIISILNVMENCSNHDIFQIVQEEFLGKNYQIKPQSKKKKIR